MASTPVPTWILFMILYVHPLVQGLSLKKGVAVKSDDFYCEDFEVLDTMAWWHDWRCDSQYYYDNNICTSVMHKYSCSHTAMVWGYYPNTNYSCYSDGTVAVQGPNEPNRIGQSNLSPQEAADGWMTMQNYTGAKILVSPSASKCSGTNCNYGNTTVWFDEFFRLCVDCRVDYLATHTYWCGANKTMDFLEDLYIRYNRTIWLTEFACRQDNNNPVRVYEFMEEIVPRLEAAPFIARFAWYMLRIVNDSSWVQTSASLMQPNSSELTDLGRLYRDL